MVRESGRVLDLRSPAADSAWASVSVEPLQDTLARRVADKLGHLAVGLAAIIGVIFLVAPLVTVFLASFNVPPALDVPPSRWSTVAYESISGQFYSALGVSIRLAIISAALSLVFAVPAVFWLARSKGKMSGIADGFFRSPLQVPEIVIAVTLYQGYVFYGATFGITIRHTFLGLVAAHVLVITPYVIATCTSRVVALGMKYEEAGQNLGASSFRVFVRVSLPMIKQALIASAALTMLVSFDNVPLALFLTGPDLTTLPVFLFNQSQQQFSAVLYACAAVTVLIAVAGTLVLDRIVGLRKALLR